jgi:hypothetical protein
MKIRIAQLEDECQKLREENASLRNQLGLEPKSSDARISEANSKSVLVKPSHQVKATPELSIDAKIQLFRSLFKGREDVYSIRWDSKNGRSGYTPACDNEWLSGVCDKPRIKCSDCNNRMLLSINYQAVYLHLTGKKTIGVYALLTDETCWFLAADFDGNHWQDDATAFTRTAKIN